MTTISGASIVSGGSFTLSCRREESEQFSLAWTAISTANIHFPGVFSCLVESTEVIAPFDFSSSFLSFRPTRLQQIFLRATLFPRCFLSLEELRASSSRNGRKNSFQNCLRYGLASPKTRCTDSSFPLWQSFTRFTRCPVDRSANWRFRENARKSLESCFRTGKLQKLRFNCEIEINFEIETKIETPSPSPSTKRVKWLQSIGDCEENYTGKYKSDESNFAHRDFYQARVAKAAGFDTCRTFRSRNNFSHESPKICIEFSSLTSRDFYVSLRKIRVKNTS